MPMMPISNVNDHWHCGSTESEAMLGLCLHLNGLHPPSTTSGALSYYVFTALDRIGSEWNPK